MDAIASRENYWTPPVRLGLWLMIGVFLVMGIWRPIGIWLSWIVVLLAVTGFVLFAGKGLKDRARCPPGSRRRAGGCWS